MIYALLAFSLFVLLVAGACAGLFGLYRSRSFEERLRGLERRLGRLESGERPVTALEVPRPAADRDAVPVAGDHPTPSAEPAAGPYPPAPADATSEILPIPERASAEIDWESLITGRVLNRIGMVVLLLATAFFLKYAFDNQWIGPLGRVAIGLVAGSALMVASQSLLGRGYRYFSEGIAALGAGVLYLSLFAAWDFYELIPQGAAFAGMILVTAALGALAWGRGSQRLAVLALLGGLSTPVLLDTGVDRQVTLFSYLAILVGAFVGLAWGKRWRWPQPAALVGFLIYYVGWFGQFYDSTKILVTLCVATLFFVEFALPQVAAVLARRGLELDQMLLAVANAGWFGVALHALLFENHRWWLTAAVLLLGGFHLVLARSAHAADAESVGAPEAGRPGATRFVYAGIALAFVTAAIPIRLEGDWIRIAWAIEGALLVWAGLKGRSRALRAAGVVLTLFAALMLLDAEGTVDRFFFNPRFLSFAAVAASLAAPALWARSGEWNLATREQRALVGVGIAANAVATWGLSEEVWRLLGRQQWNLDPGLARQMGLSLLWTVLAALLLLAGMRAKSKVLRWQGLVLLAMTVLKAFLLDLSFLERAYRIVSFLVLGLVLIMVSFLYQRTQRKTPEEAE